jgi:chromosome partitioning protein
MHIIVALLKAGKRVASFDLDLNQLTLTRYLGNRHEWDRRHEQKLEQPDHYPVTEEVHGATLRRFISRLMKIGRAHKDDFIGSSALSHSADLGRFISQLKKIGRARKHDFIVIDTPGGVQHLALIAHGMADTLITPINDSLVDLDVLLAIEQNDLQPQPSVYAKTVWRALFLLLFGALLPSSPKRFRRRAGEPLIQCRQLARLFCQHFKLLSRMSRPNLRQI